MKTIALRFGEYFAPDCGTIAAHQKIIDELGYVWYGKMGRPIATYIIEQLLEMEDAKILLINSGKKDRYWAHISEIKQEAPEKKGIPSYYRDNTEKFKTWFKVTSFDIASKDIMSRYYVASSGKSLRDVSKHSMSPYFIIENKEKSGEG